MRPVLPPPPLLLLLLAARSGPLASTEDGAGGVEVVSVAPRFGSCAGGTDLSIRCSGLELPRAAARWTSAEMAAQLSDLVPITPVVLVAVGGIPCDVLWDRCEPNVIVCRTRPVTEGSSRVFAPSAAAEGTPQLPVSLEIRHPGSIATVTTGSLPNSTFRYRGFDEWRSAPVVERVIPTIAYPGDEVTLYGRGIPSEPSYVDVSVGGLPSAVVRRTSSSLVFLVPTALPARSYNVSLRVDGVGFAALLSSALRIDRSGTVHTFQVSGRVLRRSPSRGNALGGERLTIWAEGVSTGTVMSRVSVNVDGTPCAVDADSLSTNGSFNCILAESTMAQQMQRAVGQHFVGNAGAALETWLWPDVPQPETGALRETFKAIATELPAVEASSSPFPPELGWDLPGRNFSVVHRQYGWLVRPQWESANDELSGPLQLRLRVRSTAQMVEVWVCQEAAGFGLDGVVSDGLLRVAMLSSGDLAQSGDFGSVVSLHGPCRFEIVAIQMSGRRRFLAVEPLLLTKPEPASAAGSFSVLPTLRTIRLASNFFPERHFMRRPAAAPHSATLMWGTRVSPAFDLTPGNATAMQVAIQSLASAHCEPTGSGGIVFRRLDYEDNGSESTAAVLDDAFCGRNSLSVHGRALQLLGRENMYRTKEFPFLCMGYKVVGLLPRESLGTMTVVLEAAAPQVIELVGTGVHALAVDEWSVLGDWVLHFDDTWHSSCFDLDLLLDRRLGGQDHVVTAISVDVGHASVAAMVDEFTIQSSKDPLNQVEPLGIGGVILKSVHVEANATIAGDIDYFINLTRLGCSGEFPLMSLNGRRATRVHEASEALAGSFTVSSQDNLPVEVDVSPNYSDDNIRAALEQAVSGVVHVERIGCYNIDLHLELDPGLRQSEMNVADCNLIGTSPTAVIEQTSPGGYMMSGIPRDWMRTTERTPQVQVSVEGIPLECAGVCGYNISGGGVSTGTVTVQPPTVLQRSTLLGDEDCSYIPGFVACHGGQCIPSSQRCLYVSSVTPNISSVAGGQQITIAGGGFSASTSVDVGGTDCTVDSWDDDQLLCTIAHTSKVHEVTNSGVHPSFGPGLLWDQARLTVHVGDSVRWTWEPAWDHIAPLHQVIHSNTSTPDFQSSLSASGTMTHMFTTVGLYHFASEPFADIGMTGTVLVTPSRTKSVQVAVVTGGALAQFSSLLADQALDQCGAIPDPTEDSVAPTTWLKNVACGALGYTFEDCQGSCVPRGSCDTVAGCDDLSPRGAYTSCSGFCVPIGTCPDQLHCEGIEEDRCAQLLRAQALTCHSAVEMGAVCATAVRCECLGTPTACEDLIPEDPCASLMQAGYSCNEAQALGFSCAVSHECGKCEDVFVPGDSMHCTALATSTNVPEILLSSCVPATPEVLAVSPLAALPGETISIMGHGFGNSPVVQLGGLQCQTIQATDVLVSCAVPDLSGGSYDLSIWALNKGFATGVFHVQVQARVSAVSPFSSSLGGGAVVAISGSGFSTTVGQTAVTIGNSVCTLASATSTEIVCTTGRIVDSGFAAATVADGAVGYWSLNSLDELIGSTISGSFSGSLSSIAGIGDKTPIHWQLPSVSPSYMLTYDGSQFASLSIGGQSIVRQVNIVSHTEHGASAGQFDAGSVLTVQPVEIPQAWSISVWFIGPLAYTGSPHCLMYGSDGSEHVYVPANLQDLGVMALRGSTELQFEGSGGRLDRIHNGWHHLSVVAEGGKQKFYLDGTVVGQVEQQINADIIAVGNKPSGTQPWGGFNAFILYSTALMPSQIAAMGTSHYGQDSGLLFTETAVGVVPSIARSYGYSSELSIEFWVRKPDAFRSNNNFRRQMILSGVDEDIASVNSGFVFWINPCGELEMWVRIENDGSDFHSGCVWPTLEELQCDAYLFSNCPTTGGTCSLPEIKVGVQAWSVLKDPGFASTSFSSWVHVIGTYSGTAHSLYRDGDLVSSRATEIVAPLNSQVVNLQLGGSPAWASTGVIPFTGGLDEIALYPYLFDNDDAMRHASYGSGAVQRLLVAFDGVLAVCPRNVCSGDYDADSTAVLNSISPVAGFGDTVLTLSGQALSTTLGSDAVAVMAGESACTILTSTDVEITCLLTTTTPGLYPIVATIGSTHVAVLNSQPLFFLHQPEVIEILPTTGSLRGGTVMQIGMRESLADATEVTVLLGDVACTVAALNDDVVECVTGSRSAPGTVAVNVFVNGIRAEGDVAFLYYTSSTPEIMAVTPANGFGGDVLRIDGRWFSPIVDDNTVTIDGEACIVQSCAADFIECYAGYKAASTDVHSVQVHVTGKGNAATSSIGQNSFQYSLAVSSLSAYKFSFGGENLVVNGAGFCTTAAACTQVMVCEQICTPVSSTYTLAECIVPPMAPPADGSELECDVTVTVGGVTAAGPQLRVVFNSTLTPQLTAVSPQMGSSGGGTRLHMAASGLSPFANEISAQVGSAPCTLEHVWHADCTDVSEPFTLPSWPSPVDRSCTELMQLGWDCTRDMSVVSLNTLQPHESGYNTGNGFLLRDQCTASCARTLGTNCSLPNSSHAEGLVCITDEHAAASTSVSVRVSRKGIATTTASIASFHYYDLWSTARTWDEGIFPEPGSSVHIPARQIVLLDVVPPPLFSLVIDGGKLVFDQIDVVLNTSYLLVVNGGHLEIGTDSNPFQHQCVISLLTSPAMPSTYAKYSLPFFGMSVLALADGIIDIHGSPQITWTRFREAAAPGATRILVAQPVTWQPGDTIAVGSSSASVEDAEVAQVQTVSDDRMIITLKQPLTAAHFGLASGEDSLGAEVGLINRNVVLQGNGVIVAPTVPGGATLRMSHVAMDAVVNLSGRHPIHIHNAGLLVTSFINGCSIVAADGGIYSRNSHGLRVRGNVLVTGGDAILSENCDDISVQDNLAMALAQPDPTEPPRAMVTISTTSGRSHVSGNAVGGATGTGFVFVQPSVGPDIQWAADTSAAHVEFENNTAHSNQNGMLVESLGASARLRLTVRGFTAYLNRKSGAVFQHGEVHVELSWFLANTLNNVLVAHAMSLHLDIRRTVVQMRLTADSDRGAVVADGIALDDAVPLLLDDVQFVFFDQAGSASIRASHPVSELGSQLSATKLTFCNSPNRVSFATEHQLLMRDIDGTLTGSPGWALPASALMPSLHCSVKTELSSGRHSGMSCTETTHIVRMRLRVVNPPHITGHQATIANSFGSTMFSYQPEMHEPYLALVPTHTSYRLHWENLQYIVLRHLAGTVVGMRPGEYVAIEETLDLEDVIVPHFVESFVFNETARTLTVAVAEPESSPSTQTSFEAKVVLCPELHDLSVHSQAIGGCHVPGLLELSTKCTLWSSAATWPSGSVPSQGEDVMIAHDMCVLLDFNTPTLGRLTVRGDLQFLDTQDLTLTANHLRIEGGRVMAGSTEAPFAHRASFAIGSADLDSPAIEVYGLLQLVGLRHMTSWTKLQSTASLGSFIARLQNAVDWGVGDEIVVASSNANPSAFETAIITQVSTDGKTLALDRNFQYDHTAGAQSIGEGSSIDVSAEVGLISRRVKIDGRTVGGCGILVGKYWKWEGSVELVGVEVAGCNDIGGTNPLIEFREIGAPLPLRRDYFRSSQIRDCSFHSASSTAVHAVGTSHLTVETSVILSTAWSAVVFEGARNQLKTTMGISINPTPECNTGTCSNACGSKPCQNGAPCINIDGGKYFCACLHGWNGTDCEMPLTDINGTACSEQTAHQASCLTPHVCEMKPCLNGGLCVPDANSMAGFFCSCGSKFRGRLCDVHIEELRATFEITGEHNVVRGNAAAGSTRAGFRLVASDSCHALSSTSDLYFYNNVAHSNLIGLELVGAAEGIGCAEVAGLHAFRNWDLGVYAHVPQSVHLRDSLVAESVVGVLLNVYGPDPVQHEVNDKSVTVSRTVVVGKLSTSPCGAQTRPLITSFKSFPASHPRVGLMMSSFTHLPVRARDSWMAVDSSYPALSGGFFGFNLTLSDFGPSTRCPFDDTSVAIANNPVSHAGHPHHFSGTNFLRNARSADFLFSPGTSDAARHSLVLDSDGALGGGVLVPNADMGEGVEMQSTVCTRVARLGIRRCPVSPAPSHRMLVFESMDADCESRRIAPLTLSSPSSTDLLQGPSLVTTDATNAAETRSLSTFFPIVAVNQLYNVSFHGGSPFHCRLRILHALSDDGVLLQLNYTGVSERLDVYQSGIFVRSSGLATVGGLSQRVHGPHLVPTVDGSPPGANYYDDTTEQLNLLVQGPEQFEIVMAPVLKVSIDMATAGPLSKPMFVEQFAVALSVEQSNVVIVRVSEVGARRRQQTGAGLQTVVVEAEIGEEPSPTRVAGAAVLGEVIRSTQSSLTSTAVTLVSLVQSGALADALSGMGVTAVSGLRLVLPVGLDRTAPPDTAGSYLIQIPQALQVHTMPSGKVEVSKNFTVAAVMQDSSGRTCTVLGLDTPWNLTASIKPSTGSAGATLSGKESRVVFFEQGIATFKGLSIDVAGAGYIIALRASNGFYVETSPFDVGPVPVPFNLWLLVIVGILFMIMCALMVCTYSLRRSRNLKRIVPMTSLLDGVERISQRVATPDLHYLPRPDTFIGVPIQDLFTRDPTTVTAMKPTASEPALLEVEVIRARNLKRMDLGGFGKSDPFCVVEQQKITHYTDVIDNDLNPVWNESFSFWVKDESKDLIITMFDKDTSGADLMGEVRFTLSDLTPLTVEKGWHPLRKSKEMKKKETVKGDIKLAIKYSPRMGEPQQLPLVLRQMFDTLEDDGINRVGIFRLSSDEASTSMKQLKRKHKVHRDRLSALRYDDDTMALANLLVYTFASLPTPLLPKSTTQAKVEGVIDGLPTTHYLVLIQLLGMLHRFAKNAAVNLMTAHNLAVAFAPVLWRAEDSSTGALAALLRLWIELGPQVLRKSKLLEQSLKALVRTAAVEGIDMEALEEIQDVNVVSGTNAAKQQLIKLMLARS